ncbi:hypothetical protein PUN28_016895 [Cardiocondyla obscurior]|uniref:DUF7041 domain-containing protein n=1 Tax=Cardiocondyla obscurior TaxID=286306 RepID=A0AAW2EP80_9HYME
MNLEKSKGDTTNIAISSSPSATTPAASVSIPPRVISTPAVPKLAMFSHVSSDPKLWFKIAECALNRAKLTEEQGVMEVILPALDQEAVNAIRDLLLSDPFLADLYKLVKERIINTFTMTPEQQLRNLGIFGSLMG